MDAEILDGIGNMDFERITQMLSDSIWANGITIDRVKRGAANSALVVGAFCDGVQVGYARVISDKTEFAYIGDVYVDEAYRHNGIATKILRYILAHESLKDVYKWLLKSAAHELYAKVGFVGVSEPERWMEIRKPRPW